MNQTQSLLNEIVENARMGADACAQLLKKTEEIALRRELQQQQSVYEGAIRDAEERLYAGGFKPIPTPMTDRMGVWMGTQMKTLTDRSPSHIAEMTIQGASMGIIDLTKARNSYPDADSQAQGIAAALIEKQQQGIDRMKQYLTEAPVK